MTKIKMLRKIKDRCEKIEVAKKKLNKVVRKIKVTK